MFVSQQLVLDSLIGGLVWSVSSLVRAKAKKGINATVLGGAVWALGFMLRVSISQVIRKKHPERQEKGLRISSYVDIPHLSLLLFGLLVAFVAANTKMDMEGLGPVLGTFVGIAALSFMSQ